MTGLGLNRRENVILVSQRVDPAPLWQLAVALRADHVVVLPGDQQRLIDHLSDLADGGGRALTARRGRGAWWCRCVDDRRRSGPCRGASRAAGLLLDADPLGGGIELVLGCEDAPGLRWPEVVATEGRVGAVALRSALPSVGSLAVLSWDATGRRPIRSGVMHALVGADGPGTQPGPLLMEDLRESDFTLHLT